MTQYVWDGQNLYADNITAIHSNFICDESGKQIEHYGKINKINVNPGSWKANIEGQQIKAFAILGSTEHFTSLHALLSKFDGCIKQTFEAMPMFAGMPELFKCTATFIFITEDRILHSFELDISRSGTNYLTHCRFDSNDIEKYKTVVLGMANEMLVTVDKLLSSPMTAIEGMALAQNYHEELGDTHDVWNFDTGVTQKFQKLNVKKHLTEIKKRFKLEVKENKLERLIT